MNEADEDEQEEGPSPNQHEQPGEKHNLDYLRQKASEFEQQKLKGIQLTNAGTNDLPILSSHPVTSSTCSLI